MKSLDRKKAELGLISRKKLWPRVFCNYMRMVFLRQPRLKSLDIALGYDCQCSCVHCYAAKLKNNTRNRLGVKDFIRAVNEAIDLGAIHFNISGGEPLLYEECFELLGYIKKEKRAIVSLATNGILLTMELAARLKNSGLDVVEISLDSSAEETHDRQRSFAGAYSKVMDAISNARKAGLIVFISTVATNENLLSGEMARLALIAKKSNAILHLNTACSSGRWQEKHFYLSSVAKVSLKDLLKMSHVRINTEAGYFTTGCKAGLEKIALTAYGDIMPCAFIQMSFGNIYDKPLGKIWKEMRSIPYFNGKAKECLPSQNKEFIAEYMTPLSAVKQLPYSCESLKDIKR